MAMAYQAQPSAEPLFKNCPECAGPMAEDFGCENPGCDNFAKEGPLKGARTEKNQTLESKGVSTGPIASNTSEEPKGYVIAAYNRRTGEFSYWYDDCIYTKGGVKSELDYLKRRGSTQERYQAVAIYTSQTVVVE